MNFLRDPIDRLAIALGLLLAAAASAAAWRASVPHPAALAPPTAAQLWQRHCAHCHERAELLSTLRSSVAFDQAEKLTEFLATHGRANAIEDRIIAEELSLEIHR